MISSKNSTTINFIGAHGKSFITITFRQSERRRLPKEFKYLRYIRGVDFDVENLKHLELIHGGRRDYNYVISCKEDMAFDFVDCEDCIRLMVLESSPISIFQHKENDVDDNRPKYQCIKWTC